MQSAQPAAHIRLVDGRVEIHSLQQHLRQVARLAREFADRFGGGPWGELAGLWHDLGKYRDGFQRYIAASRDPDAHIEGHLASRDKTHSAAGALHALRTFEDRWGPQAAIAARTLAYVIGGHHAGLGDWTTGIGTRLLGAGRNESEREHAEAVKGCQADNASLLDLPPDFDLRSAFGAIPGLAGAHPLARSIWVRMIFSALVDADFLDTEAFMDERRSDARSAFPPIDWYLQQLDAHLAEKQAQIAEIGRANDVVMRARAEVLRQCREKALHSSGVFTLTVPTGGGKTLSSLAFALRHAKAHSKRRVVYAIPYTSIIEQTADVFGSIFGADNLVEHHSQFESSESSENHRSRLACENWDAPLIVTTNVQLFESLFASRTSRCRKLHNLADSVIILDEAQLVPPQFLQPILDALNVLVAHYGVTLVLCTATQPALTSRSEFDARRALRGLPSPTPIIDNGTALFDALKRVRVHWPADLSAVATLESLAATVEQRDCVLVVLNTRKDASELTRHLPSDTLHLSAAMCGAHRKAVIDRVRAILKARQAGDPTPLRVVSTQLVEAGVDLDFPVVYRALAGLDSIAQAAGRCNREGLLPAGEVFVFVRELPAAMTQVRLGAESTRSVIAAGPNDPLSPGTFEHYFRRYYTAQKLDARDIVADLADNDRDLNFGFRTAADKFRLVDDEDQAPVIVPYHLFDSKHARLAPLLARLRRGETDRWLLRAVQRYMVNVRRRALEPMHRSGSVQEVSPGLFILLDELQYDARFGLLPNGALLDPATLVQ